MAFIRSTNGSGGGGGSSVPTFTYVGGTRGNGLLSYTFTQNYNNIFIVSFAENASETFTTVNFPSGSTHEEVASVDYNIFTSARGMRCYDIHNVSNGSTFSIQWLSWSTVYIFTY